jgi:glutamate formiminotransferase/formiminotetrahydrofolate cyclodeaminase
MKIKKFLEDLASDTPTPGGGSAAALSGALSASLVAMVAGLSYKKGQPESGEMKEIRKKALMIQKRLYRAIEEDARFFDAVMEAFRLPRDEEKQRLYRSRMIQKAYQKATVTPQKVCELSLRLLEFSEFLLRKGNQNAFSDTGVGSRLAHAAFEGGMLNVRINLGSIRDKSFRTQKERFLRRLVQKKDRLMAEIENEIKSCGY